MGHDHAHMDHLLHGIDALSGAGFLAIVIFSFLASWHCIAMCGPLVCSKLGRRAKLSGPAIWVYNLGRMFSYFLMGVFLGWLQNEISDAFKSVGVTISIVLGLLLIQQGFSILLGSKKSWPFSFSFSLSYPTKIFRKISVLTEKFPLIAQDFMLGFFTVLLPCMTLTPALIASAGAESAMSGGFTMLAFFFGTLPSMVAAPLLVGFIGNSKRLHLAARLSGVFLLLAGTVTILRVWH
ncbi:MAG: sulfite exporter TauE/SafE family protein [Proteobacteria bacterium]|nr:sulfite exporter TauE/SafE family protein [Pseudomonadota bacterium]